MSRKPVRLSKSRFVAGCQCLKRLYLRCYAPELAAEVDAAQQAVFDRGNEVGELAQQAFPGGKLVDAPYNRTHLALDQTERLMADPSVPALYEAAFIHDNCLVRVDVLERRANDRWRLIEVKSTSDIKEVHAPDVAIQKHVLEGCGLELDGACLMHLNRDYVYDGVRHDLDALFRIVDLTSTVIGLGDWLPEMLRAQKEALARSTPPVIDPGPQCTTPYTCEFYDHCNPGLPEHHVSSLYRMHQDRKDELVRAGMETLCDIPDGFPLSTIQRRMVDCVNADASWFAPELARDLASLRYPVCFMDFETIQPAVPRFAGMRPYGFVPFQWSVHVQDGPGAELRHFEYLSEDSEDPREPFTRSLLEVIEREGGQGHVMVYHQGFEKGRLSELAAWLPQYADRIEAVRSRVWDLLPVVRNNVYHPAFHGSFSIKKVLPALIPDMSYDGLAVAEGTAAGLAYERMIHADTPAAERATLRAALLEYCGQDTLAMVRLLEALRAQA